MISSQRSDTKTVSGTVLKRKCFTQAAYLSLGTDALQSFPTFDDLPCIGISKSPHCRFLSWITRTVLSWGPSRNSQVGARTPHVLHLHAGRASVLSIFSMASALPSPSFICACFAHEDSDMFFLKDVRLAGRQHPASRISRSLADLSMYSCSCSRMQPACSQHSRQH